MIGAQRDQLIRDIAATWIAGVRFMPTATTIARIRERFPDRWGDAALGRPLSPQLFAAILRPLPANGNAVPLNDRMGRYESARDALLADVTPTADELRSDRADALEAAGTLIGGVLVVQLPADDAARIAASGSAWILRDPPTNPRPDGIRVADPPDSRGDPPTIRVHLVTATPQIGRLST